MRLSPLVGRVLKRKRPWWTQNTIKVGILAIMFVMITVSFLIFDLRRNGMRWKTSGGSKQQAEIKEGEAILIPLELDRSGSNDNVPDQSPLRGHLSVVVPIRGERFPFLLVTRLFDSVGASQASKNASVFYVEIILVFTSRFRSSFIDSALQILAGRLPTKGVAVRTVSMRLPPKNSLFGKGSEGPLTVFPSFGVMCNEGVRLSDPRTSHVLFLAETHVPIGVRFLETLLDPFVNPKNASEPVAVTQCTSLYRNQENDVFSRGVPANGSSTTVDSFSLSRATVDVMSKQYQQDMSESVPASLSIVDHGLRIGITVDHYDPTPVLFRELSGFGSMDRRAKRTTPIDVASMFCMMVDKKKFVAVRGFYELVKTSVWNLFDKHTTTVDGEHIQVDWASMAEELLNQMIVRKEKRSANDIVFPLHHPETIDSILSETFDIHSKAIAANRCRQRIFTLEKQMESLSLREVQSGGQILRQRVREAYNEVVEATKLWERTTGKSFDEQNDQFPSDVADEERAFVDSVQKSTKGKDEILAEMAQRLAAAAAVLRNLGQHRDTTSAEDTAGFDLSLRLRLNHIDSGSIVATGAAAVMESRRVPMLVQMYNNANMMPLVVPSLSLSGGFYARWKEMLMKLTSVTKHVLERPLRVVWDAFCCGCCGFSSEIVHFVVPLQFRREVHLIPRRRCFCDGYPHFISESIERMHLSNDDYALERRPHNEMVVWVSHTDPMSYKAKQHDRRQPDYVVGRSMYEFSRIGQNWVDGTQHANEIWVPAVWVRDMFFQSGVPMDKLHIIPEAIDTYFFDPEAQGKIPLPLEGEREKWFHYCNGPAPLGAFKFFSNFKWEPRKGWDILFEAYFRAFRDKQPVSLYILTIMFFPGAPQGDIHNHTAIVEQLWQSMKVRLADTGIQSLADFPHFCIITESITEIDLAMLYNTIDAFVLPTKGEGWGLPTIQAMAMQKPVISTDYGGSTEFTKPHVTFLIPIDGVEEVPEDSIYGYEKAKRWAIPSLNHTTSLIRYVYDHPAHAAKVGARARKYVVRRFSEDAIADLVEKRLDEIHDIVMQKGAADLLAERHTADSEKPKTKGPQPVRHDHRRYPSYSSMRQQPPGVGKQKKGAS